jgi:F-box protein 9
MYWLRPRLRTDGLYCSRNTYLRKGEIAFRARAPIHLVVYFRYLAFTPSGDFLYRCTPAKPASQRVLSKPRAALRSDGVYSGELQVRDTAVHTVVTYAAGAVSHVHTWLRLRSTSPGANDRLDVRSMVHIEDGQPEPPEPSMDFDASIDEGGRGWHAAEGGMGDWEGNGATRPLRRGLSRFVFVPWDCLDTTVLNLDAEELDYFHAG